MRARRLGAAQAGSANNSAKQEGDSRLRRRLLAVEKLGAAEKRQVLQLIDAFIERGQLRSKVQRTA
jgi:isochorismate synthase EntC